MPVDLDLPIQWEWTGALEGPSVSFTTRGPNDLPVVKMGQPQWFPDERLTSEPWTPPAGSRRFGLARFAFALNPIGHQAIQSVDFTLNFKAVGGPSGGNAAPLVFDLYPKTTTEEQTGSFMLGVEPKVKIGVAEVSGFKAEVKSDVRQTHVVTRASGVQQTFAQWQFKAGKTHPLEGDQVLLVMLQLAPGVVAARASAQLSAEVATSLGPLRGFLPQTEQQRFSWVLQ